MQSRPLLALAALFALVVASAVPAAGQAPWPRPESFDVELSPVGDSGVTGIAHLVLRGDRLTVLIRAFGLDPMQLHPVIIHGFPGGRASVCPDAAPAVQESSQRFDGEDARSLFGHGLVGLDPSPQADLRGAVTFEHGYDISHRVVAPLSRRVVVLYHGEGIPLACGEIRAYPSG